MKDISTIASIVFFNSSSVCKNINHLLAVVRAMIMICTHLTFESCLIFVSTFTIACCANQSDLVFIYAFQSGLFFKFSSVVLDLDFSGPYLALNAQTFYQH